MFVGGYGDAEDIVAADHGLGLGDEAAFEGERLRTRLKRFVLNFRVHNTAVYREQLRQHYALKRYCLEVDLENLVSFDSEAAQKLIYEPSETFPYFEDAVAEAVRDELGLGEAEEGARVPKFQIIIQAAGNTVPIRRLNSDHVSRLVFVPGIVVSASRVRAKATELTIRCRGCQGTRTIPCSSGFGGANLPPACLEPRQQPAAGVAAAKCPPHPYSIVADRSVYVDHQTLKLQEQPDSVPTGEMPRHVMLSAERYLVDKASPGTRVLAVGIYTVSQGGRRGGKGAGRQTAYVRLVGLEINVDDGGGHSNTVFTPEEEDEFIRLSRNHDIRDMIARSIAPAIYGHDDIKRVVACLLFGGTRKFLPDGMRLRGDINVLLLGDPGMAKSQILKFASLVAPIGIYTSGKGSSAAGLTASVVRDPASKEFYLEGGAMVIADGGVVCIAEGSTVALSSGLSVPIESVPVGAMLAAPEAHSAAGSGAKGARHSVVFSGDAACSRLVNNGERHCIQLTFEDGRTLVCTEDHQILASDGTWVAAGELDLQSRVAFAAMERPLDSVTATEDPFKLQAGPMSFCMSGPGPRDKALAFARLVGYSQACGSRSSHGVAVSTACDLESIQADVELLVGCRGRVQEHVSGTKSVALSARLWAAMNAFDHASLHSFLLEPATPVAFVREFLAGYLGGEGLSMRVDQADLRHVGLSCVCEPDAKDAMVAHMRRVQSLLRRCGVSTTGGAVDVRSCEASFGPLDNSKCVRVSYMLPDSLEYAALVGFRYCARKELRLAAGCAWLRVAKGNALVEKMEFLSSVGAGAWFDTKESALKPEATRLPTLSLKLVERRPAGIRRVYDLSVPGPTSFFANGVAVHNCIDEFDKMRLSDQVALHEAMEQQSISIAKAGLCTVLNARTSVLAAANPMFGSYDESRAADQNIEFHATILSRFDSIFLMKDSRSLARDKEISNAVLSNHIQGGQGDAAEVEIPIPRLKRYIAYAKARCQPCLDEDAMGELQNRYISIRSDMRKRSQAGETPPIPITVRQLEAIVRLSESLAKQELSPVATRGHVQEAIRLFRCSTLDAASSGVASAENLGAELMEEINTAENLLKRRLAIGSRVTERRMVQDLSNIGISAEATRRAISVMAQRGEIEYRQKRRQIMRIR